MACHLAALASLVRCGLDGEMRCLNKAICELLTYVAKEGSVPFDLSEEQLEHAELELGAKFPQEYREAMKIDNGGEASTEENDWVFYPIRDTSDRKGCLARATTLLRKLNRAVGSATSLKMPLRLRAMV